METKPKQNQPLSKEVCRLISGIVSFINDKDKELKNTAKGKGEPK